MLAIRMQRTGRRGHAQFRVIVQDARRSPASGQVVARLGSYDPHTKVAALNSEKTALYLKNGAQPSERVAKLLKKEGIKLPDWVSFSSDKKSALKNPDKLRRNRPASAEVPQPAAEIAQSQEAPVLNEAGPEATVSENEVASADAPPESSEDSSDRQPADVRETPAEETPIEATPEDKPAA